ncbi:MAG: hypothetical protein WCJ33_01690, partial [Pseudomonadota bacterium]
KLQSPQLPEIIVSMFALLFLLKQHNKEIWFVGIATIWMHVNSLLLPYIDETKSYRPVIAAMNDKIQNSEYKNECLDNFRLGESIAPMLQYFDKQHKFNTVKDFASANCNLLLTVTSKKSEDNPNSAWSLFWRGSRILDAKDEELRLYVRKK